MVALLDPRWTQGDFITLVSLFNRVGLKTNFRKTVGMVFCPCQAAGMQLEAAYVRRMTVEGPSYWERQRIRIQCKEYGEEMELGSLAGHMQKQHGKSVEGRWHWEATAPREEPRTYSMALPNSGGLRNFPVEGYPGRATAKTAMQVHFFTGMSGIPLSFWKRENSPTHGAPAATCWYHILI